MNQSLSNKNMPSSNPENSNKDDNVIEKQVCDTHHPDGTHADVKTLIYIADKILGHAKTSAAIDSDSTSMVEHTDVDAHENAVRTLYSLSNITDKLACEMPCIRSSDGDGHTTALSLLQTVGNFHWDAKLALVLASFALKHGEFWLLPQTTELSAPWKINFDTLTKLSQSVLKSTRCIMQLMELPSTHLSADVPALDAALITVPVAVYWNVRGIIDCATEITSFRVSVSEMQALSTLFLKINELLEFLKKQLEECNRIIGDRKDLDFKHRFNRLFETSHIDNMEILKVLINSRDDPLPLFYGVTKKRVSLEVVREKNVMLLISGLDISSEEVAILEVIYKEFREYKSDRIDALYDIVWVPIVDPSVTYTNAMNIQFEEMKNSMPWYSVSHPSNVDTAVKKAIGDRWNFRSKPILVVLDPKGKELNRNALHMLWIWGSVAFPLTTAREEALWRDETWRLELVADSIDPNLLSWIFDKTYIFLYGGDDIEWIRKFTTNARAIATTSRIPLEMLYVGKGNRWQNVQRAMDTIKVENLSDYLFDNVLVWFFWTRLKSILFHKNKLKPGNNKDLIMVQTKKILGYEKEGSWALLSRGSDILTHGYGSTMLQTTADFDLWKEHIPIKGFDLSFKEYHDKLHVAANNCCRVDFPHEAAGIPEDMGCPECGRVMGKHISFLCCHD